MLKFALACDMSKNMLKKTNEKMNMFKCVISRFQNVVFSTSFKLVLERRRGSVNFDTLNPNALVSKCRTNSPVESWGTRLP